MKICHCIKLTDEEIEAFKTVRAVLDEMVDDAMICAGFKKEKGGDLDDASAWLYDVVDYLKSFGD